MNWLAALDMGDVLLDGSTGIFSLKNAENVRLDPINPVDCDLTQHLAVDVSTVFKASPDTIEKASGSIVVGAVGHSAQQGQQLDGNQFQNHDAGLQNFNVVWLRALCGHLILLGLCRRIRAVFRRRVD